jgi:hypothetical protein
MTTAWAEDTRSSEEIIALALAEPDEDSHNLWKLVDILRFRGGEHEFWLAAQFTESENPKARCLGARIMAQLGLGNSTYVAESVDILIPMLSDSELCVVCQATYALGQRRDERAIGPLSKLANHPDAGIRRGVAYSLDGFDDAVAINTLIRLSSDTDEHVRDWATFGLASQTEVDTPELRAALLARTNENNGEIRGEALVGLANRRDPQALGLVQAELKRDFAGRWVLEAAELVGDISLVPLLTELRARWDKENEQYFGKDLDQALEACLTRPEI